MPQEGLKESGAHGFLGVNLKRDRMNLADQEMSRAINADLHSRPGVILLRKGRRKLSETSLTDPIRKVAKLNGARYQIAEETLYLNLAALLPGLSTTHSTSLLSFRPLNDP